MEVCGKLKVQCSKAAESLIFKLLGLNKNEIGPRKPKDRPPKVTKLANKKWRPEPTKKTGRNRKATRVGI
jgi:hypothetical protein